MELGSKVPKVDLSVQVGKLTLRTPIILASGCCGYGFELLRVNDFPWEDVGALVLKSITVKPRVGKPPPRVAEVTAGMLNAIGVQNEGIGAFMERIAPRLAELPCAVIASIIGTTKEEYAVLANALNGCSGIAAIEVNISSPNIERGGIEFGVDPKAAGEVTELVRRNWNGDVWVKLSPNAHDIALIAQSCSDAGADILVLTNTVPAMGLDVRSFPPKPLLGAVVGGLSGPAIKPIVLRKVYEAVRRLRQIGAKAQVVASGGIWRAQDIVEYLSVGATAVQVGTLLLHDVHAPRKLRTGLEEYALWVHKLMNDEKWLRISSYIGCALGACEP
ncbi:MAG: dihydroorotate dehydrogenase [Armatimonadota bacterium]|nr:dihydroorotate dehydrogenase [Armatimonadota bacterium]MCX7776514.1 dihydroorotate dehydrogenase [Armatimonadota bacterium]MDW8024311.1 dihydroorotate dehydrogenase [Armatimonadota bacterium]